MKGCLCPCSVTGGRSFECEECEGGKVVQFRCHLVSNYTPDSSYYDESQKKRLQFFLLIPWAQCQPPCPPPHVHLNTQGGGRWMEVSQCALNRTAVSTKVGHLLCCHYNLIEYDRCLSI